jgi:hypothetical protein
VSDPQPPAWNNQPPQHPQYGVPPQQPPYDEHPPAQLPHYAPDSQPLPYGPHSQEPPQGQAPQQPHYGPPRQPHYGPPPEHPPYGQATQRLPQYEQLHYGRPQHGQPQPAPPQRPAGSKSFWLLAGGIAGAVALIGGVGVVLATRGSSDDPTADGPMPTATYSDCVTVSSPSPTPPPSATESPTYTPEPTPAPSPERSRTLKDVDQGIKVYDDVYVKPASGWGKDRSTKYSVTLGARNRPGAVMVVVSPVGYPASEAVSAVAQGLITADHLKGARKGSVKTLRPANSNIGDQAQLSYSGRYTAPNGVVFSLVAKCTTMTGVDSIHNVTVTVCVASRADAKDLVFREGDRMLASVARSI